MLAQALMGLLPRRIAPRLGLNLPARTEVQGHGPAPSPRLPCASLVQVSVRQAGRICSTASTPEGSRSG